MGAPRRYLAPEAEPWGRSVDERLDKLARGAGIQESTATALRTQTATTSKATRDHQAHIENTLRVPAAPGNVTASSSANIETGGTVTATVSVTADQVTTDTDAGTLAVSKYELYGRPDDTGAIWRRLCDLPAPGVDEDADDPTVTLDAQPLPSGKTWQFKVRAISNLGALGQFSDPVTVALAKDEVSPPKPSAPTATSRLGIATVSWDGKAADDSSMPVDFSHCDIHRVKDSADIVIGSMGVSSGTNDYPVTGLDYNEEYEFYLIAVDTTGNESDPSGSATVTVKPLVDTDLIGEIIDGANIKDGTITASDKIIGNSITGDLIAGNTIEAGSFKANAIHTADIEAGAVTTEKLDAGVGGELDISANNSIVLVAGQAQGATATANNASGAAADAAADAAAAQTTADNAQDAAQDAQASADSAAQAAQSAASNASDAQAGLTTMQTYYSFGPDGATITKPGSPFQLSLENDQVAILENGNTVSYWNSGQMHVGSFVGDEVVLGNHKLEKYGTGTRVRAL